MEKDYGKLFTPLDLSKYIPSQKYLQAHKVPYRPLLEGTREIENNKTLKNGGWNPEKKLWFPHKSYEGGTKTIGYGHKLTKDEERSNMYSKGLTDHQVDSLYGEDVKEHYERAKSQFENLFKDKKFDDLPVDKQAVIIDYEYTGTGPTRFPTFTKALVEDDKDTLRKEYMRYSGGKPLGTRNKIIKQFLGLKNGGSLIFKKSQLVKNAEALNTKKDLRKKIVKSNTKDSDVKRKIFKKQLGGTLEDEFISYTNVPTQDIDFNSINMNTYSFDPYSYISREAPFKEETPEQPAIEERLPTLEVVKPEQKVISEVKQEPIVVESSNFDPKYGLMQGFIDVATEENLPFRITSGYRPNARTSNGSASWHSKGLALDIVPKGVGWDEFRKKLSQSPKTLQWLKANNMGIIDETSKEMLARTGGTGAHFHVGKDKLAVETFKKWFPNLG